MPTMIGMGKTDFNADRYRAEQFGDNHRDNVTVKDVVDQVEVIGKALSERDDLRETFQNSPMFVRKK